LKRYLVDTNICIYFLKGLYNLDQKFDSVGLENCFISEIKVAELKFGAENSERKEKNKRIVTEFINQFTILPIFNSLDVYAREKTRLKKSGRLLDDFDLLIGATAISNNLILATRNISDFERMEKIKIENWIAD